MEREQLLHFKSITSCKCGKATIHFSLCFCQLQNNKVINIPTRIDKKGLNYLQNGISIYIGDKQCHKHAGKHERREEEKSVQAYLPVELHAMLLPRLLSGVYPVHPQEAPEESTTMTGGEHYASRDH